MFIALEGMALSMVGDVSTQLECICSLVVVLVYLNRPPQIFLLHSTVDSFMRAEIIMLTRVVIK